MPANNIPPLTRVLTHSKINENGCWLYQARSKERGYCQFSVNDKQVYVHRFMYEYYYDNIDTSLVLDHLCRNPTCVNPTHLEQVTQAENVHRGFTGINMSSKTHCPQSHPYSKDNTYYYNNKNGKPARHCRICNRENQKKYIQRKMRN